MKVQLHGRAREIRRLTVTIQLKKGSAVVSTASSRRLADWLPLWVGSLFNETVSGLRCLRRDAEGGGRGRPRYPNRLHGYSLKTVKAGEISA